MLRPFLFPLFLALCAPAFAHEFWLEKDGAGYALMQGHRHSGHAGPENLAYDPAGVGEALCLTEDGKTRAPGVDMGRPVRIAGTCAALLIRYTSGYWTKTAWETLNRPKTGIPGVLKSWHSEESVKHIERWLPLLAKPLGNGLELSPQAAPFALRPGDKLVVLVTDGGRPKAGVPVAYGDETRGVSGEDGKVAIRLRQAGMQRIAASVEAPLTDGKADTALRATALQFELAR